MRLMLPRTAKLTKPGLFVTATDTGVGKTVITCAIASTLRRQGIDRVGVCKPVASGCRREREGLVSEDAEALAHFADCRLPLDVIHPIRYAEAVAPAVAAEQCDRRPDFAQLVRSLEIIDGSCDCLLLEGIGGLLVPLDVNQPSHTVLDLIATLGYPVLVVARARLGTLNHTAMTIRLLRSSGCRVVGIVMNHYDIDVTNHVDPSTTTNCQWLERMNDVPVLATVPRCTPHMVAPHQGRISDEIIAAINTVYWPDRLGNPRTGF